MYHRYPSRVGTAAGRAPCMKRYESYQGKIARRSSKSVNPSFNCVCCWIRRQRRTEKAIRLHATPCLVILRALAPLQPGSSWLFYCLVDPALPLLRSPPLPRYPCTIPPASSFPPRQFPPCLLPSCVRLRITRDMVQTKSEERAVLLAREAVELVDAGHREVRHAQNFFSSFAPRENLMLTAPVVHRPHRAISEKPSPWPQRILRSSPRF